MKVYLSWEALANDYEIGDKVIQVSRNSPSLHFHLQRVKKGDKHIILYTQDTAANKKRLTTLINLIELKKKNSEAAYSILEAVPLPVTDPYDVEQIVDVLFRFIDEQGLDKVQVGIFASPGTAAMQFAWLILKQSKLPEAVIILGKELRFSDGKKSEFVDVSINQKFLQTAPGKPVVTVTTALENETYCLYPTLKYIYNEKLSLAAKAPQNTTVLIVGESGTGKEHAAYFTHQHATDVDKSKYEAINCAAFNEELLLSELFGHKKGAFTGADKDKEGILMKANGGTVFLDEIGELTPRMQAMLLRFLQERKVRPVGSEVEKPCKIRVVAATHRNLPQLCANGQFRWDLYYRLAGVEVHLPAYRTLTVEDKIELIQFLLKKVCTESNYKSPLGLSPEALKTLIAYPMPGNTRQLQAILTQAVLFHGTSPNPITLAEIEDLPLFKLQTKSPEPPEPADYTLQTAEKIAIIRAAQVFRQKKDLCDALGVAYNTLEKKLKEYQIKLD